MNSAHLLRRTIVLALAACFTTALAASAEPVGTITTPATGSCICAPATISVLGTAANIGAGTYTSDTLEYSATPNVGPWTSLGTSNIPVTSPGLLYTWNLGSLPSGQYTLRLTVFGTTAGGVQTSSSVSTSVFLTRTGPNFPIVDGIVNNGRYADIVRPVVGKVPAECGQLLTPEISIRSILSDGTPGPWQSVAVTDRGTFVTGEVDLRSLVGSNFEVRALVTDSCSRSSSIIIAIQRSNDAPALSISSPLTDQFVRGNVTIRGTVASPPPSPGLRGWILEVTRAAFNTWTPISGGSSPIPLDAPLGTWTTSSFLPGTYIIRLRATGDATGTNGPPTAAIYRVVNVGCPGDFNVDGFVSTTDIFDFLAAWFASCF
jgi:hypothetical protein